MAAQGIFACPSVCGHWFRDSKTRTMCSSSEKESSTMTTATDAGASDWRGRIGTMDASDLANFLSQGVLCHLACLKDDVTPYVLLSLVEWCGAVFYILPPKRSR